MSNSGGFILSTDSLLPLWNLGISETPSDVADILGNFTDEVQSYAQANAPWADRTGDARAELTAEVEQEGDSVLLVLSHGVDYGQWLETIQSGKFAIIMPTLEHYASRIFRATNASPEVVG